MNMWIWGATALLVAMLPAVIACLTGGAFRRFIALQMCQIAIVLAVMLLTIGYGRSIYIDVALAMALAGLGSGLVYARFLERAP